MAFLIGRRLRGSRLVVRDPNALRDLAEAEA
jgi:hypothetical protein